MMKPTFALHLVLSLALLLPACAAGPRPLVRDPRAEETLLAADRAFHATTRAQGLEGWVSTFADDGIQFPEKRALIRGHDAIRAEMAPLFQEPTLSLTWEPTEAWIAASGDLGVTIGHALITETKPGVAPIVTRTKYLTVWKRDAGGAWRIAADIGNRELGGDGVGVGVGRRCPSRRRRPSRSRCRCPSRSRSRSRNRNRNRRAVSPRDSLSDPPPSR